MKVKLNPYYNQFVNPKHKLKNQNHFKLDKVMNLNIFGLDFQIQFE